MLRFSGNSLSYETAFNLDLLGGPKIPNLLCFLKSWMVRTAIKIVVGFKDQHTSLLMAAREHFPFCIQKRTQATPIGWDSAAFCTNLTTCLLSQGMGELEAEFRSTTHGTKSFQALAFKKYCAALPHPSKAWLHLLNDRAKMFIQESSYEWSCWQIPFSMTEPGLQQIISILLTVRAGLYTLLTPPTTNPV